jgi:MFS family permease
MVSTIMDAQKRIFGLRPNVFWLGLVSLINDFSSEMIYSVMPAFLTVALGAPPVVVGVIEGFADALASILKIYFGWFSDKIRKRKILAVSGYTLSVSTRWFLALVGSFWQVFILRSIDRIGKGLRDSPRDALLSESVEAKELGKSFGYHRAMDNIGATLGPLSAVLILPIIMNDYRLLFKIGFVIGILAILTFVFVKDVKIEKQSDEPYPAFSFSLKNYSHSFRVYIAAVFVFGLGFMPLALMLLKSQEIGLNGYAVPLMYFVYNLSFVLFAIPAGKLADRIGDRKVLAGGFLAAIIGYAELLLFSNVAGVIMGFVILGIYAAMTDGVGRAFAAKLVPPTKLATGQGFLPYWRD